MSQSLLCSVVIITWNRLADLQVALVSCFRQDIADRMEVIVIDNGSTDGTLAWLRDDCPYPVRSYGYQENRGCCEPRNAGIRLARSPYVCFLDSDAEVLEPDGISRCLDYLEGHEERAAAATIWYDREKTRVFSKGLYLTWEGCYDGYRSLRETHDPMFLTTCFSVWERSLLEELGGFDPWYFYGSEDADLSMRAWQRAVWGRRTGASRFHIVEGVNICHHVSDTGRSQGDVFDPTQQFAIEQPQRLRMVLAYGGVKRFLQVLFFGPLRIVKLERETFERRLSWRERWCAFFWWPFVRLLNLPRDYFAVRRDHLQDTAMPVCVRDSAG